ncbi:response regulator [Shewanella sp. JM162201]|uniref:histidine kinase n=1 Tax=Shewanella jiangmenensis TaxID=2837387 RepID=A0ABS5V1N3_9GAMM|nr:CHASE domain-containing protein [Shewanella jiangmenensis]MBT1444378.1 response regulator [Shewanella jiangmenensis]
MQGQIQGHTQGHAKDAQPPSSSFFRRSLFWLWLPLLIVIAGLVVGGLLAQQQTEANQRRIQEVLQARLDLLVSGVHESVATYEHGLRGLRGAIISVGPDHFDYATMQAYSASRHYEVEFPGARGFGFIQQIENDERERFISQSAAERPDHSFSIRQLEPHQQSLFVIRFIEPESRNKQAIGLDIGSEANRRNAAVQAANDNAMRLTGPITLVQASNKSAQGFLILLPIYRSDGPAEPSLANTIGWSYAPLLIDEVLSTISGLGADLVLSISDITRGEQQRFFDRGDATSAIDTYKREARLKLFGREWELSLAPSAAFISSLGLPKPEASIWNALLLSLLLAAASYSVQLIGLRRLSELQHRHELAKAEENALQLANARLELQVLERTSELVHLSALQRSILDAAAYAIIATDRDGIVTEFNPSAEKLLGYQSREIVGLHTPARFLLESEISAQLALLQPERTEPLTPGFEAIATLAKLSDSEERSWTFVCKEGTHIPVKLSVTALHSEVGELTGFLGVAYDLTEQLAREQELANTREEALQASKAKSDFLANMSHEIRTPMNAVLGLLQITLYTELSPQQRDYLLKTQSAAKSLLALLNDILDFSKIEAGRLELEQEPFSLQQLLTEIGSMLSSQAQHKNIELIYQVDDDVPDTLIGDCLRLRQVLLNVLSNAVKFTEHGEVINRISARRLDDEHCLIKFTISDTGIGMSAEQQQAIFKGFHQADTSISRRYGGTGLGLAITRELINLMQGEIQVTSAPGEGSIFTIKMPFAFKPANAPSQLPMPARVMLVEDNQTTRMVLRDMLQKLGFEVLVCADAAGAKQLLNRAAPVPIDLMLIDWQLPDADGLSFAASVRGMTHLPRQPAIVIVTAFSEKILEAQRSHPDACCDATLIKPITREMLQTTLTSVMAKHGDGVREARKSAALREDYNRLLGRHLLLVEDNATNRLVATTLLRQHGARVTEAVDGFDALDKLASQRFDLVLMDIQMPGMGGYEATRQIRQHLKLTELPIVAMTANAMPQDRLASEQAGMNGHIAKPFDIDEVINTLTEFLPALPTTESHTELPSAGALPDHVSLFAKASGLELDTACRQLGDTELFALVLNQFSADIEQAQAILSKAELTMKEAKIQYHSLKSAAASCGFSALSALMRAKEASCSADGSEPAVADGAVLGALTEARALLHTLCAMLQATPMQDQA